MTITGACDHSSDSRVSPRTNLFLGALLQGPDFAPPVTVRNMSPTGALLESPIAPAPSTTVSLTRGSLSVGAVVAWCKNGRCGLRFNSEVCVGDWLPPGKGQQRVDRVVHFVQRSVGQPIPAVSPTGDPGPVIEPSKVLSAGVQCVSSVLKSLSEDLSNDDAMLAAHSDDLQQFDIALQMLSAISDVMSGENVQVAIDRLENLRVSCTEARLK